jgi:hypothetical protein
MARRRMAQRRMGAAAGAGGALAGAAVGVAAVGIVAGVGAGVWIPAGRLRRRTVPVGVAISSQPAYGGDPGCWVRRRVWTASGHYMGRRLVNVCY